MSKFLKKLVSVWGAVFITVSLGFVFAIALPHKTLAADTKLLLDGLNNEFTAAENSARTNKNTLKFSSLVNQIITIVLFIVGVAAIIYLLISGFQYVTAGGDDEKAGNARKGIINAIIGLIIVLSAWFIFRATINVGSGLNTVKKGGSFDSTKL